MAKSAHQPKTVDWPRAIKPLLEKYKNTKHPLDYHNRYQLMIMVILSAQDSDRHINQVAPAFFEAYPTLESLSKATLASLNKYFAGIRNADQKANWILGIAQTLKADKNIPRTQTELTALKGIGRKSANVILRESGCKPEGVIVDLHVLRVAPRLGIAEGTNPEKIEKQIMAVLPQSEWDAGMAMSFLGREICRPTNPKCEICPMRPVCRYYHEVVQK